MARNKNTYRRKASKSRNKRKKQSISKVLLTVLSILAAVYGSVTYMTTEESDSETLKGKVIRIADGDTMTLLTKGNKQVKVRLYGIDCPERGQDFGMKAKDFVSDLCAGKEVSVEKKGTDIYERTLGVIYLNDLNINEELLRNGLAWRYKHNKDSYYLQLENEARNKKINIWSSKSPTPPWDFRKNKKTK